MMSPAGAADLSLRVEAPAPIRSIGADLAWGAALTIAVLALLLVANAPQFMAAGVETADFAANTLLILDAKSSGLLTGNYSRVGFNHPGPAILYVLAAGEVMFHDWLDLVPSAFSGQLVAVSFYSAFWIALVFRVLCRAFDAPAAALGASLYALCIALLDFQTLNGIWFPHLYVLPFGAFVVAASRLVHGRTDALGTLALSTGFLANGHASFVVIVLVMGLTVLCANTLLETSRDSGTRILSPAFLAENRWPLVAAGALLFLFFVPLIIRTVASFPGPVTEYVTFGAGRKSNGILASLRFIWSFWGGPVPFLLGALVVGPSILVLGRRRDLGAFARSVNGLLVVFVAAFLGVLTYARHGVDVIEFRYLGYFYYSVPALAGGLAGICLLQLVRRRLRPAVSLLGSIACLAGVYPAVARPADYADAFNSPQAVDIYRAVKPLAIGGRIVLDLDGTNDWGYVWSNMVGAQAYAKRQRDDLVCIDKNWHILFTRAALCSPAERATRPRYVVRKAEPKAGETPPDVAVRGLTFTRTAP